MAKKKQRKFLRYTGFTLMTLVLVGICCVAICGAAFAYYISEYVSKDIDVDLDSFRLNFTSFIYYIDEETGQEVELEQLHGTEARIWADLEEIPVNLQNAFIAVEDNTFEEHNGVNWRRTIGAALNYVVKFRDNFGGGSTITQQLIKNLTGDDETSVKRKIQEVMRALEVEKNYEKDDILELYLNTIYFGQSAYGVRQAAYTYFDKELDELSIAECAAIAGITKNPYKYDLIRFPQYNAERRMIVLEEMKKYGKITEDEYNQAINEDVQAVKDGGEHNDEQYQSYFVDAIIDAVIDDLQEQKGYSEETAKLLLYTGGLKIVSTIDPAMQAKMDSVFQDLENFPGKLGSDGTMPQASMVIMDPYTGEVKALYGGRGEKEGDRVLNRATQTKRSPGSSIKPLTVYAPAIENGVITPITVFDDVPTDFTLRASGWPKNESNSYSGKTTIRTGIAKSLNTIAVQVMDATGIDQAFDFAYNRLNLSTLVDSRAVEKKDGTTQLQTDKALGALALGGLTDGVTVLDMTAAYSSFTNDGYYVEPVLYTKIYDSNGALLLDNTPTKTEAMSSKTATYMLELLKYAVSNGTGSRAALGNGIEVGGKTGTTTSNYDRWFAGITPYYTGVVWFGYDRQQEVTGVSTNPALYLWKEVMAKVHEGLGARSFNQTTELVNVNYCLDSGLIPNEYCSQDERGSRVASAKVAREDIPTEVCSCHIKVEVCGETGLPTNEFCTTSEIKEVVRVQVSDRVFPVEVAVGDREYCLYPEDVCEVHNAENDGNAVIPDFWPGEGDFPGSIEEWWENRPEDGGQTFEEWWNSLFPNENEGDHNPNADFNNP
ncbi:MAG: PBP1A family penicillin-binding protein [Clostridia bacterium]|nr:PBP1A family penicillin-binding protein [Clostridia bacterium]